MYRFLGENSVGCRNHRRSVSSESISITTLGGETGTAMSHNNRHRKSTKPRSQFSTAPEQAADNVEADSRDDKCTVDRIRIRAFQISQDRRGGPGDERSDWLQAERELQSVDKGVAPGY